MNSVRDPMRWRNEFGCSVEDFLRLNVERVNPHQVQLSFGENAFTQSKDFNKLLSECRDSKKLLPEEMRIEIREAITKPYKMLMALIK